MKVKCFNTINYTLYNQVPKIKVAVRILSQTAVIMIKID